MINSGFPNRPGYLAPYRGTNYHIRDRRWQGGDSKNERFNYWHASLHNVVEWTFGLCKNRFQILSGIPRYEVRKQRDIIITCTVVHNFIKMFTDDAELFNTEEPQEGDDDNDQPNNKMMMEMQWVISVSMLEIRSGTPNNKT